MGERLEFLFKAEQIQKITVRDYNYYSISHLVGLCIGKRHSIYEVFTAKVGKVAGEFKIVRSGSEVITGSFD